MTSSYCGVHDVRVDFLGAATDRPEPGSRDRLRLFLVAFDVTRHAFPHTVKSKYTPEDLATFLAKEAAKVGEVEMRVGQALA